MMLYILLLIFILLLAVSYIAFKKDIIEPAVLFIAAYIISIFCTIININEWGIDYGIKAFFIILFGAI